MNKFELYHPILTEHFALDWLTHSKVRDIFELRHDPEIAKASDRDIDATIEDTTTYVNQMMRLVMNNEALIWGITDQNTHEFLGTFCIWDFDQAQKSASVRFEILRNQQHKGIMSEVLRRMSIFSFEELGLEKLLATALKKNTIARTLLEQVGFSAVASQTDNQNITLELNRH
ncbi:GNAT family N-acetyltransferase [Pediococcus pentosaceus]|uniref:GNAT family N-acetyltransferase n=1 Tax=Pediococcus pentosaceus TaxID=1255 RepID=UPI0018A12936|nr:GNAT family N-acetyltransferase [Pediococcus pentosaceus]MBF7129121.1 GNAT family N-acetyltransferase [Pediococcus pentosaceus]MBF7132474.1 GNAT family N-acetyltransferase [Pediococcus pentosaceus]